jgi:hypothetical protein
VRRALALVGACAALLLSGCGSDEELSELASLAPSDAALYVEGALRPQGDQRAAVESLVARVGRIDDPGAEIVARFDESIRSDGIDLAYAEDIAPWLGERASIFLPTLDESVSSFCAVFETTSSDAAQEFVDKMRELSPEAVEQSHEGVDYVLDPSGGYAVGLVDDHVVFGTEDSFQAAVDASGGDSLAGSTGYEDGVAELPDERLGTVYVDLDDAVRAAIASSDLDPIEKAIGGEIAANLVSGPMTLGLSATSETATVDVSLPPGFPLSVSGTSLLERSPASSWLAVAAADAGESLGQALELISRVPGGSSVTDQVRSETGLDLGELASWLGDGRGFVSGTSEATFALGAVGQSSDRAAAIETIDAVRDRAGEEPDVTIRPPLLSGAEDGFSTLSPGSRHRLEVDLVGDEVVAALSASGAPAEDALEPGEALSDDESFGAALRALGSDYSPLAYLSFSPFLVVAEEGGSASDPDYIAAKPYLEKLDYLALGTLSADGDLLTRLVIGVE